MDELIKNIISTLKNGDSITENKLANLIRRANRGKIDNSSHIAKKYIMPYYLNVKSNDIDKWRSWNIDKSTEKKLISLLLVKPKRSASGVATITVITKPWKCGGNCLFCPNDIRMPKSYLSNEPACQRAERNFFDPFLQVSTRLKALHEMGHSTDKIEVIVLGGTWNDYTLSYQKWFVSEIFRALNVGVIDLNNELIRERENIYIKSGISNDPDVNKNLVDQFQDRINNFDITYNQAWNKYYKNSKPWNYLSKIQKAKWDEVFYQHKLNETSKHRCVGLVFETRPKVIDNKTCKYMRRLGCTKVQMGIQSLNEETMSACNRHTDTKVVENAFAALRKFGFKIHIHFMVNLPLSNPKKDKLDFKKLVTGKSFLPDEIKLYPCMLVESANLNLWSQKKMWIAYDEDTLVDILTYDLLITPQYVRISRMMRDISSFDIIKGVKKTNLRQMVEDKAEHIAKDNNIQIQEIRHREISTNKTNIKDFLYKDFKYKTSNTEEHFLQYVTKENKILGFCRLSLPTKGEFAMIREVHVYGKVASLGQESTNAQHLGLGKSLIDNACIIAKKHYKKIKVISAIGTRNYYKKRGFNSMSKDGLYQVKNLC